MVEKKINNNKLIIISVILVVLLVYYLVFEKKIQQVEKEKNNLFSYSISDINKFVIESDGQEIEIDRVVNEWGIKKPIELKASKNDVESFLYDVRNLQKIKEIDKSITNLSIYGLTNAKVVFKVWLAGKKQDRLLALNLGDQNPDKSGYYAKFENQPELILLENLAGSAISKDLFYFRQKDIFQTSVDNLQKAEFSQDNKVYTFSFINNNWIMNNPINYSDISQIEVKRILGNIVNLNIKRFFDEKQKVSLADTGLLSPNNIINLVDKLNKNVKLLIGKEIKDSNQYYAKKENEDLIFAVDKMIVNDLFSDGKRLEEEKIKKDNEKKLEAEKNKQGKNINKDEKNNEKK